MHKDSKKIKARIRSAFKKLFNDNIIGFTNFTCCNNCGGAEIRPIVEKDGFDGWAFYHAQDNECINELGTTHITFGENKKIAKKIIKALEDANLKVSWNGKMNTRISVDGLK
jgi:hypothetical protein